MRDLTAVIPVWGSYQRFLDQAIATLKQEGVAQIIVVANGEALKSPPDGVRVIETPTRLSIGECRNVGLAQVTTEFVVFHDVDDAPVVGALGKLVATLHADPALVLASGMSVLPDGTLYAWPPAHAAKDYSSLERLLRQWEANHISLTVGTVLRTTAVRKAGGFPDWNLAEDGALGCVLVWLGKVSISPEPTRIYNTHPDGLCQRGWPVEVWEENFANLRRYLHRHPALPLPLRLLAPLYRPLHRHRARWLATWARHSP